MDGMSRCSLVGYHTPLARMLQSQSCCRLPARTPPPPPSQSLMLKRSSHGASLYLHTWLLQQRGVGSMTRSCCLRRALSSPRLRLLVMACSSPLAASSGLSRRRAASRARLRAARCSAMRFGHSHCRRCLWAMASSAASPQTICAAESLSSRGHEIGLVVLLSDLDGQSKVSSTLGNAESLRSHFGAGIPIFELPEPPPMPGSSDADDAIGDASCGHDLDDWLEKTSAAFDSILDEIESVHEVREHRTSAHGIDGNAHGECPYLREKQPVAEEAAGSPTAATEDPSMTAATEALLADDMRLLWHPYTSTTRPLPCLPVKSASGVRLRLHDGTQLIDGMSSWWCTIHGYAVPELDRAVASQIGRMSHVMFGGLTHQSAVGLAQRLVECTPEPLQRVFLCDSGSVSVEVAIKMAIQYYKARGVQGRDRLLTVRGGYHGDTFGAMAVCDPVNGMHSKMFGGVLPKHIFAPRPAPKFGEPCNDGDLAEISQLLDEHRESIAAIVLEPIVQGAGGMHLLSRVPQARTPALRSARRTPHPRLHRDRLRSHRGALRVRARRHRPRHYVRRKGAHGWVHDDGRHAGYAGGRRRRFGRRQARRPGSF